MRRLTFVCNAEVLTHFPALTTDQSVDAETPFTLQVTDAPFMLNYAPTLTHWKVRVRTRGQWAAMSDATLSMHKDTELVDLSNEDAAAYMPQYFNLCRQLSAYAKQQGWSCDVRTAIELYLEDGKLCHRVLTGAERPPLMCVTLSGQYKERFSYWACVDVSAADLPMLVVQGETGDVSVMRALAALCYYGNAEVPKDARRLAYWNQLLVEKGEKHAAFELALQYAHGYGVERDFVKACEWMEKAAVLDMAVAHDFVERYRQNAIDAQKAEEGDVHAQTQLASTLMLQAGTLDSDTRESDYQEALQWAQKAADQGSGLGLWLLANAYENGLGVNADLERAVHYYRKGSELDSIECKYGLATHYLQGEIIALDELQGYTLALEAAQAGHLPAMRTVADCYMNGTGTTADKTKALEWYRKAAEQTNDPAVEEAIEYLLG